MPNGLVRVLASPLCLPAGPGITANAKKKNADEARQFQKHLAADRKSLQPLNRLTYGPRPGDVQDVKSIGLKKWIDRQLHPETVPENPVLAEKLKTLDTLQMSGSELVRNYPTPQMVKQMVNGQLPFPADPDRKLMLTKLMDKYEERPGKGRTPPAPNMATAKTLTDLLAHHP